MNNSVDTGKVLLMGPDKYEQLTGEQIFERYQKLIYKYANKWSKVYGLEDAYQMTSLYLIKAYKKYDIKKGVSFGSYAMRAIENEFNKMYISINRLKRKGITLSIYDKVPGTKDVLFIDTLKEDDFTKKLFEKYSINKVLELIKDMPKRRQTVWVLYINGCGPREIMRQTNISRQTIYNWLARDRERFQNILKGA